MYRCGPSVKSATVVWWQQIRRGEDAGVWTHPLQHESATDAGAGQGRDEQENASGENLLIGLILARISVNSIPH